MERLHNLHYMTHIAQSHLLIIVIII